MNLLDKLELGLTIAMQQQHLLLLVVGCLLGAIATAMPGLGVLTLVALALPVSLAFETTASMMLLVGIYCGGCGGVASTADTARSLRMPLDGGAEDPLPGWQGSAAQMVAVFGAAQPLLMLTAALIGAASIAIVAPWLIEWTFRFGPAEYFSMMVLGLLAVVVLSAGSLVKSLSMLVFGLLLAQIGIDPQSGSARFDLDYLPFDTGIGFIPLSLGLIVVGRLVTDLLASATRQGTAAASPTVARLPWRSQMRLHGVATVRGAAIGSLFGAVPGGGVLIGGFAAGAVERRLRAGETAGDDPTVTRAPAAALVAGVRSSFIPMLALGVPTNAALALMIGLLMQQGLPVGPQMMTAGADLFWGLVVAIAISGLVLFVLGRPLAALARRLETVDFAVLYPVIGAFCCLAAFSLPGGVADVWQVGLFGVLGHLLFKLGCPLAPLLMGFIVGPTMETSLRRALELSGGDWSIVLTRPISAGLLLAGALLVAALLLPSVRPRRAALFGQEN